MLQCSVKVKSCCREVFLQYMHSNNDYIVSAQDFGTCNISEKRRFRCVWLYVISNNVVF